MRVGQWVDERLPFPGGRRVLRRWRRTRPFWGGVFLIAGGAEIMLIPMSPLSILITLGVGGLAALAIGSVLVVAGVCLWLLPAQRHFVSLVALIASVVSFAATNLGGFLVGMALGVVGSSMGFGWRPRKVVEGGAEDSLGEVRRDGGGAGVALALPLILIAGIVGVGAGAGRAAAAGAECGAGCVRAALDSASAGVVAGERAPVVTASYFAPVGFAIAGVAEVPTRAGPLRVLVLRMGAAGLGDYRLTTRDAGAVYSIAADRLALEGDVTIYVTRLFGCIEGLICLTFSAEGLPLPPVIPPFVFMTRVEAEQVLVTADRLGTEKLVIGAG